MARLYAVQRHAHEHSPYYREAIEGSGVKIDRVDDLDCFKRSPVLARHSIELDGVEIALPLGAEVPSSARTPGPRRPRARAGGSPLVVGGAGVPSITAKGKLAKPGSSGRCWNSGISPLVVLMLLV